MKDVRMLVAALLVPVTSTAAVATAGVIARRSWRRRKAPEGAPRHREWRGAATCGGIKGRPGQAVSTPGIDG